MSVHVLPSIGSKPPPILGGHRPRAAGGSFAPVPSPNSEQLGRAIRRERRIRDLSIEALAAEAGVNRNHLGDIERGKAKPTWDVVVAIADGLGVGIADLVRVAEEFPPGPRTP